MCISVSLQHAWCATFLLFSHVGSVILYVCTCTTGIQHRELKPSSSIYWVNSKCHLFLPIGNKMVVATTKRKGIWFIKQLLTAIEKHCTTTHVTTTSSFLYLMSNLTLLWMFLIPDKKCPKMKPSKIFNPLIFYMSEILLYSTV